MRQWFRSFHQDNSGQELAEYSLLLAFVAVIAIIGMMSLGLSINASFSTKASGLLGATAGGGGGAGGGAPGSGNNAGGGSGDDSQSGGGGGSSGGAGSGGQNGGGGGGGGDNNQDQSGGTIGNKAQP